MKKISTFAIAGIVIAAVAGIATWIAIRGYQAAPAPYNEKPSIIVAVSFYPLAEFAKQVGGENVEVDNIVPPGADAHDFEPSLRDIARVHSARVFIFNGAGFDPWAERIGPELKAAGVFVINMAEHFELLKAVDGHKKEPDKKEPDRNKREEKEYDPHIWLDPALAKRMVEIIRDALKEVDPANAQTYENNAGNYLALLSELDEKYRIGLAECAIRDAVTSHAAFGYLAKRYNLNMINIAGLSPKEEPSPRRMAEIAELARAKNIQYIFFETLVLPKLAETIAREIGVQTVVFNPIEGLTEEELAAGENYISIMEKNLANLRTALRCQ
jgi:zinc transport system substrate-binding protein